MVTNEKSAKTGDAVKQIAPATPVVSKPLAASVPEAKAVPKPVAKPVAAVPKAAAKLPAKAAAKAPAKSTAKPAVKAAANAPLKAAAKSTPKVKVKAEKPAKEKKAKLVRDSFTIPKGEYTVLDELKQRAGKLSIQIKKSELLRAGIKALAAMSDSSLLSTLKLVPTIKTGRPSKV
jgi:hypothetical protein